MRIKPLLLLQLSSLYVDLRSILNGTWLGLSRFLSAICAVIDTSDHIAIAAEKGSSVHPRRLPTCFSSWSSFWQQRFQFLL